MKNLFSLLERFSLSLNKDTLVKEAVSEVINKRIKISIDPENISMKNGVLEIKASPVVKNELVLKEELIRQELKEARNINISRIVYK